MLCGLLFRKPLIQEALAQSFTAEQHFRADSFALALNGDGNALGFKQIIDEYGNNAGDEETDAVEDSLSVQEGGAL